MSKAQIRGPSSGSAMATPPRTLRQAAPRGALLVELLLLELKLVLGTPVNGLV